MSSPLISVIVPAWNAELYLSEAIDSLLAQTEQDFEIIVINDGSTDNTEAIARRYEKQDARIRVITRATSSGKPAIARNEGIRIARGEFVALLDSDDISVETRFEEQLAALRTTGAQLVFSDTKRFTNRAELALVSKTCLEKVAFLTNAAGHLEKAGSLVYKCNSTFPEYMFSGCVAVNTQTVMFCRSLLNENETPFDEALTGGEDWDLFLRLADRADFAYVHKVHSMVRTHNASITRVKTLACATDAAVIMGRNFNSLRQQLKSVTAARNGVAVRFADVGYHQWLNGSYAISRKMYSESIKLGLTRKSVLGYLKTFIPFALVKKLKGIPSQSM